MAAPRPLEGLLVVSLEQAVAAPMCTVRLADAGARVIKVERPDGDFARGYDRLVAGESSYFVWLNRGKESLVLDLKEDGDKEVLSRLLAAADVLVQNLRPGALARLGFTEAALRAANSRLIMCNISGFAPDGQMAERKSYDLLIQAESGLCSVTGSADEPGRVGISICDITTGMTAYQAILEALLARASSGAGTSIDVSMFDVLAELNAVPWLQWRHGGRQPPRLGLRHPSIQPYGVWRCGDGTPILLAIQNEREWAMFCARVVARPELAKDPRFHDNSARVAHRDELEAEIGTVLSRLDGENVCIALDAADIAYGRLNDMAGLDAHPEFRVAGCETTSGPVQVPVTAPRFAGEARPHGPVPALGADSAHIRAEFAPPGKPAAGSTSA
jgi:crotonobetainyl-CoA:carnitine CoA-transferase CaiB-like acyl-CoA transferase